MSSVKNVCYICKVYFIDSITSKLKYPVGSRYYNEIKCIRMYEGDPRINKFKNDKDGNMIWFDYTSRFSPFNFGKEDINTEKKDILRSYMYYNTNTPNVITIINNEDDFN